MGRSNLLDSENFEIVGARALFQRTGTIGYLDIGSVMETNTVPTIEKKQALGTIFGRLQVTRTVNTQFLLDLDIKGNELYAMNLPIVFQGSYDGAVVQAAIASPSIVVAIASVEVGKIYPIHTLGVVHEQVLDVIVKVGIVTMVEGTDYKVDYGAGMVEIMQNGTIVDADIVDITAGCNAVTRDTYTQFNDLNTEGTLILINYDDVMFDEVNNYSDPVQTMTASVNMFMKEFPKYSLSDYSEFVITASVKGNPTVSHRTPA